MTLDEKIGQLVKLARAQEKLLIAYRLQRRPPESALDTIAKYKHLIK